MGSGKQYAVMLSLCPFRLLWTAPWILSKRSSTQPCSVTGKLKMRLKSSRWEQTRPTTHIILPIYYLFCLEIWYRARVKPIEIATCKTHIKKKFICFHCYIFKCKNVFSQWYCWLYCTGLGAHSWPEAAHWGPVQWPAPVPIPGREAAAGEAKDGGAQRVDSSGWAQGPAVCGNLPSAESSAWDRGQAERTGPIHSAQGTLSLYELHTQWMQSIWKVLRGWRVSSGDD